MVLVYVLNPGTQDIRKCSVFIFCLSISCLSPYKRCVNQPINMWDSYVGSTNSMILYIYIKDGKKCVEEEWQSNTSQRHKPYS